MLRLEVRVRIKKFKAYMSVLFPLVHLLECSMGSAYKNMFGLVAGRGPELPIADTPYE